MDQLKRQKEEFQTLIDLDTDAFNNIMEAFRLPKENDLDKKIRSQRIEEATIRAIEIPLQVATKCNQTYEALVLLKEYGNKNCTSDLGVAALLLYTAQQGALMNMKINLPGVTNEQAKLKYQAIISKLDDFSNRKILPFVDEIKQSL